jgi:hypothetical protein
MKFLARDAETGHIGTFQTTFVVPNLDRETARVPISSVVLSSQRVPLGDALFSLQKNDVQAANPLVFDGQKLIPSVTRVFSRSRNLYVFLQAYERGATTIEPLLAFVALYRGDVKALETPPLPVTDGLDPRSKAVPMKFNISLDALSPAATTCSRSSTRRGRSRSARAGRRRAIVQAASVVLRFEDQVEYLIDDATG